MTHSRKWPSQPDPQLRGGSGYQTEYLSRVLNREELLSEAEEAGMTLEREFLMPGEIVAAIGAPEAFVYRGFLLRPVASTSVRSFDASCE